MEDVVIVAAVRTAIGKFGGSLAKISATEMGATVIHGLLARTGLATNRIDEVILGQVLTAGCGQNPARQALIRGGLPEETPAMTINKVCGSGLKAVMLGVQAIRCGDAGIVIAGGQENMSASPHLLSGSREGVRMGDATLVDTMVHDGLWDSYNDYHMGITAENLARRYGISREEQDAFALASQSKASQAQKAGRFKEEIVPVEFPGNNGNFVFANDEFIKHGATSECMARLRPVFDKTGTVTAGNSSGVNDGAAAVMLMGERRARELGLPVLARVRAYASSGVDPAIMGIGPAPATRLCLKKAGWTVDNLDVIEANEAFAAQAIAVNRELGWDTTKINPNGGSISIGHPIGASGCRIFVTLLHEMARRDAKKGLATLCIGGGMGVALAVER